MRDVVIVGATRTAIGKFGGTLSNVSAIDLGSHVIKESLSRAGISPTQVDEVIMGCTLQAGQGQNPARQAAIKAGVKIEASALTINNVCGSGLKSVNIAASMIQSGQAHIVIAGGMENMSSAPYVLSKARFGYRMGDGNLVDTMLKDSLIDAFNNYHMGITAENIAEKYNISREMQDSYSASSQQRCEKAQLENKFVDEICPIPVKIKNDIILFDHDEFPRKGVTAENLHKLSPAFKKNGTVTAANASGINDGAAALVLMSIEKAIELNIKPMARWIHGTSAGVEPSIMGIGPVYSTRKLLKETGISINEIDLFEANEAFAVQALAVAQQLNLDLSKTNVNGGAIALGHPVGASGARILVTLLYELRRRELNRGLATLCVGGGMGVSTLIENYR